MSFDVAVVGCGPAGWIAADALARAGLAVGLVAPAGHASWSHRLAAWVDELAPAGLRPCLAAELPAAAVRAPGVMRLVERPYGLLDGGAMRARLGARLAAAGARWIDARVRTARVTATEVRLETSRGTVRGRLVVDATGHRPVLVRRPGPGPTLFQVGYGMELELPPGAEAPSPELAELMDWRGAEAVPPSFLYALRTAPDRAFFEETVLLGRSPRGLEALRARLQARLAPFGPRAKRPLAIERCVLPLDPPMPDLDQPIVGFGAAASFVHPSTGYQVGHAVRKAPQLAETVATGLAAGLPPEVLAREAWRALWSPRDRRRRAFGRFGAALLARMDGAALGRFFADFFARPERAWRLVVDRRGGRRALFGAMLGLLVDLDARERRALWRAIRDEPAPLLEAFLGPWVPRLEPAPRAAPAAEGSSASLPAPPTGPRATSEARA
ncbi:MAG TPA: lycopene cyclase family protein [Sandaracinaceae bacterium LLY-WYZ-13_1]|nr:lycopene cyclase family protein [Sandaracinaceae bacterium LLY-WYZ-13_1]